MLVTVLSVAIAVVSLRYFVAPATAPLLKQKHGLYRVSLLAHAAAALVALAALVYTKRRTRQKMQRIHHDL